MIGKTPRIGFDTAPVERGGKASFAPAAIARSCRRVQLFVIYDSFYSGSAKQEFVPRKGDASVVVFDDF